ncbi:DHA2 family efflux MFS transporter permease subunit [Cohnella zeiphila]|uniref:DHA2 family efflux MFS transporter permease subunit n=1 Tax=Cohnella zeiphila TaxID=2761120 RepID=A0A7X0SKV3_9BACL|nr:DHA2 family efflux MFS transporter permease subunit [Cohnella zeiphila]MBB6731756.1 DHA2 family efflux MFS transporter permease subunit [Cohnella zeiphila]
MSVQASKAEAPASGSIASILGPLIAIIVGLFMVILDGTAVNVAIPKLQEDFNSSLSLVQWTVTGYALAQAAVIPLAGWLSDRFGAKRIFLISIALFTIGSLLCSFAQSAEMLILFRVLQGLGGGVVMPISMAFVYRMAPPDKVGAVMGMMGVPILLAPALGPVLAGSLVDYASWHWIFLINLPIGVIAVLLGIRTLPNIDRQSVASLDLLGIILAPLAFAALSYGVTQGGSSWTSTETLVGLIVGVVALVLFVIVELRSKNPLLELRVFRSGNFTRGIVVQWVSQFALFGSFFLVPVFLQSAKGYTAFDTGLIMLPQAIASGVFMPIGGRLSDRFGARPLVLAGMIFVIGATALLANLDANDGKIMVMIPLALLGAGMGLFMMPLNTHLIQSSPQNLVGRVTSLTNAAQQVVSSLAIATLTTLSTNKMKDLLISAHKQAPELKEWTTAFSYTFFILIFVGVAGAILGLLLSRPKVDPNAEASAEIHMMVG